MTGRDWAWEDVLDAGEIRHLDEIEALERLRIHEPVVWMVLTGHSDSREIASKLGWPYDFVIAELRRLKKERVVIDISGKSRMLWQVWADSTNEDLLAIDRWRSREGKRGGLFRPAENDEEP